MKKALGLKQVKSFFCNELIKNQIISFSIRPLLRSSEQ